MGAHVMMVCTMDGQVVGYTRWQDTADVLETHAIHRTSQEAADRTKGCDEGDRAADDVLVRLCDIEWRDNTPRLPGLVCWANKELTLITEAGFWMNPWDPWDYGYCDVTEPSKHYVAKFILGPQGKPNVDPRDRK
jgi:hypothetical protein